MESDLTYEEKPIKILETSERVTRRSSFAKFSGVTILRKKQLGNEKMNSEKTTRTYLLANPNLEGEIHLKGVRLVTSQFLGKEFIKFAHEIMHHFMHSSTLHSHTFQSFALFLNQTFSVCLITEKKFHKLQKTGLFQIRMFCRSLNPIFKRKQKRKRKENKKGEKGPGGRIRPGSKSGPWPIFPPRRSGIPSLPLPSLT
jgi:hypothetical protein